MASIVEIAASDLSASVNTQGAQLWSLRDKAGRDLLWDGDATFWASRAPILFPVIGESPGGAVRHQGKAYPMNRHGFARDMEFQVSQRAPDQVILTLRDGAETRAHYPFAFELRLSFALSGASLAMDATATNTGPEAMPASFGFHPAFRWPLVAGFRREAHVCRFAEDEAAPLRPINVKTGLMLRHDRPTPVEGRVIKLQDALFEEGALVFDRHLSRSLWFGVPGQPGILAEFPLMPQLGVWTRPGFPFLCIEPWAGIAEFEDADGELARRPGITLLEPGQALRSGMRVSLAAMPA
jgi:galactose mutarotase-like enzyme